MNPTGLINRAGSTVTVRKPDRSTQNADQTVNTTWSDRATGIKVAIQPLGERLRVKLFGAEAEASFVGFAAAGAQIQEGDGLIVTAGYRAGDHFRVVDLSDPNQGPAHVQLALELTPESF